MDVLRIDQEYNKTTDFFEYWFIGDCHLGADGCDEKRLKKNIDIISNKKNARVILMGDIVDAIGKRDKRITFGDLADWIPLNRADDIPNVQIEYAAEMFRPIADKIEGSLLGNHELTVHRHDSNNIQRVFCEALQIKALPYCAYIGHYFKRKSGNGVYPHKIFATHSRTAGGMAGAKVNNLHKFAWGFDGDMFLKAHDHEKGWAPEKPQMTTDSRCTKIVQKTRHFGLTGSYLKTYKRGSSSYGEIAGYPPVALGSIFCRIWPEKSINGKEQLHVTTHIDEEAW